MKSAAHRLAFVAATAGVGTLAPLNPAAASVPFGQQEVDQNKFAAIAAPAGQTGHKLLILEQLNSSRPCWTETGASPTIVEPELLKFDFTGICGRNADSNGYSLRVAGEDLGLRYSIRTMRQNGDIKLVAVSNSDRTAAPIEIGKTNGLTDGFAKIQLNPGWRLTRRVYNGQPIGHIYLTTDQSLNSLVGATSPAPPVTPPAAQPTIPPAATPPAAQPTIPPTATPPTATPPAATPPAAQPAPAPSQTLPTLPPPPQSAVPGSGTPPVAAAPLPSVPITPTPRPSIPTPGSSSASPAPTSSSLAASMGFSHRVVVPASTDTEQARVKTIVPNAFRTTIDGQVMMQAGLFRTQADADALQRSLVQQNLQARVMPIATVTSPPVSTPPVSTPAPVPSTAFTHRVVVPASTATEQSRVRTAVPDAFRTTVNGQMMMQVGLFRTQAEANAFQRSLSQQNLQAQVLPISVATAPPPASTPPSTTTPRPPSSQVPNERLVVVIDPGHGGRDPGAVGIGGLREKDITTSISLQVASILERQGIQAVLTRRDDRELDLAPRVQIAERANADLFVSIHANALSMSRPDVNGVETFYHQSGRDLAQSIQSSIIQSTGMQNRGVKQAQFYVIRNTSMPSVLVEVGFVTGRDDAAKLRDPAFQTKMAEAIARGILNHVQRR
ncbi:DUF3747 domain-containing protein [Oculatella sp. LEGE 06141]|uniref:DUF3747 domain-containing protein n=1 Tax=Oculatella sp. LEGE 06141 TaxID=1828648 RepID=UPI001881A6B1|nr:DUF3747 domain-containing protein [Oculatella sp. LEGE 06141]MBE9179462.1 DUF3747 domain-containing protein [Oculatella sp. LEGE 06141]